MLLEQLRGRVHRLDVLPPLDDELHGERVVGEPHARVAVEHHVARVQRQMGEVERVQRLQPARDLARELRPAEPQLGGDLLRRLGTDQDPVERVGRRLEEQPKVVAAVVGEADRAQQRWVGVERLALGDALCPLEL